jgi:hypothetical protein
MLLYEKDGWKKNHCTVYSPKSGHGQVLVVVLFITAKLPGRKGVDDERHAVLSQA